MWSFLRYCLVCAGIEASFNRAESLFEGGYLKVMPPFQDTRARYIGIVFARFGIRING
jgi:hypothetical protein